MSLPSETQVLIVGAGPVGMSLAVSCALRGIDAVIIDDRGEMQNTCRAALVHARTLEVMESLGVTTEMLNRGLVAPFTSIRQGNWILGNWILCKQDFGALKDETLFNCIVVIPQNDTEQILVERLRKLGRDVIRPKRVVGLRETDDHYNEVSFESGEVVKARYVVGADGSRSTIRKLAGIRFFTRQQFAASPDDPIRLIDSDTVPNPDWSQISIADAHLSNTGIPPGEGPRIFVGQGMTALLPLPSGSYRVIVHIPPGEDFPKVPTVEFLQKLLSERIKPDIKVDDIVWGSHTRVKSRISEKYYIPREGNGQKTGRGGIMLVGDAAHIHSPAGGQGMNLGIRDAVSLGLAIHLDMNGHSESLARWAENRQKVAAEVLKMTDRLVWTVSRTGIMGWLRSLLLGIAGSFSAVTRHAGLELSGLVHD